MPLNQTLVNQINTPVKGPAGGTIAGEGEPGLAAPTAALPPVTGDGFFDTSASLDLYPLVYGGVGGAGQNGDPFETRGSSITTDPSPTLEIVSYSAGTSGIAGGIGGAGALSTITFDDDAIGSIASPYGGPVDFGGNAYGGTGGAGGGGGVGGGTGGDEVEGDPATGGTIDIEGSTGGDAGAAAPGGDGGDASYSVSSLSEVSLAGNEMALHAYDGVGGLGGYGAAGGDGATAGDTTAGTVGGNGGNATVSLLNSSISDQVTIEMQLAAYGGDGGDGGLGGGPGAFGGNAGDRLSSPWTSTITYAPSTAGGNGGAAGTAVTDMAGNTLAAPTAFLEILAYTGDPGAGGTGGPAVNSSSSADSSGDVTDVTGSPAGATGAQGQYGQPAEVAVTDNTVTVSDDVGLLVGGEGQATITDNTLMATSVLQLSVALQNTADANVPLDGAAGGNLVFSGNSLIGGGSATLDVSNCGTGALVDDQHGLLAIAGSPGNSMTGFSNFTLDSGATFVAGMNNPQVVYVAPDADTIVVTPGHAAVTLDDTTAINTILQFRGYGVALDSVEKLQADTTQSGGNVTIDVPGDGTITLPSTGWSPSVTSATFTAACFAAATRLMTCRGEVAVEDLRVGDRVPTVAGKQRTVQWIGRRTIACGRHPRPRDVWPVRIAAGAFDRGRPARELWLSPDHAVFTDGLLIPIRYLINGATVVQEAVDRVSYYHVELDRHAVVVAEGLPAESYLDTGNRAAFDNGGAPVQLHADFALKIWSAEACAPLVVAGPVLEVQQKKTLARAVALGNRLLADPRLCVQADGHSVKLRRADACYLARLPAGTRKVRLISRSAVPAWTMPGGNDHRALGIAVTTLRLDDADLADAAFGAGWHAREPGLRWTDGDATLAVNGGGTLAIHLAPLLRYWVHTRRDLPERRPAAVNG